MIGVSMRSTTTLPLIPERDMTMSFMQLQVDKFDAYRVETNNGSCIVPCDLLTREYEVGEWGNDEETLGELETFCEGYPSEYTVVSGWFSRYSAPGFMDQTDYCGPYPTAKEAADECKEMYGDEEEDV